MKKKTRGGRREKCEWKVILPSPLSENDCEVTEGKNSSKLSFSCSSTAFVLVLCELFFNAFAPILGALEKNLRAV